MTHKITTSVKVWT